MSKMRLLSSSVNGAAFGAFSFADSMPDHCRIAAPAPLQPASEALAVQWAGNESSALPSPPGGSSQPFPPAGYFFTQAECLRRMKALIEFCQVGRKRMQIHLWHSPPKVRPVLEFLYDHEDPASYVNAPAVDECFIGWIAENSGLFVNDSSYRTRKLMEYASEQYYLKQFFSVVAIRSVRQKDAARLVSAVACLGSIHHAPRIFCRLSPSASAMMHKLDAYADLC